jgi:hypothetical protein
MLKKVSLLCLLLVLLPPCPSQAQFSNSCGPGFCVSTIGGGGAQAGRLVLNCCDLFGSEFMFVNFLEQENSIQSASGQNVEFQSYLTSDMYPADTSSLGTSYGGVLPLPASSNTYHWIVDWQGTCGATSTNYGMQITNPITVFSGSSFVSGSTASSMNLYGSNGSVEFTWNSSQTQTNLIFQSAASFTGCKNVRLYRKSDQAAINSGAIFNPDFISALAVTKASYLRTGDINAMLGNLTSLASDTPTTALSYLNGYWKSGFWAGSISGGDAYAATLAGATLTDGQTLQGQFTNANTTTSPTLSLNGGGAVSIFGMTASALSVGQLSAGSQWTLIYDAKLNEWLAQFGPLSGEIPTSLQVQLANAVGMSLWYNVYCHTNDNGVAEVGAALSGLNGNLASEWCNEVWNPGFPSTDWAIARGAALGFQTSSGGTEQQAFDFYGLRVRQVMGALTTAYGTTKLKRINAGWVAFPTQSNNWRFAGTELCGTSCGNSLYAAAGLPDYNVSPNRPVDFSDALSYATYYNGAVLNAPYSETYITADLAGCSVPGTNSGGLQCAADNYSAGDTAAAFAWIDNDVRQGMSDGVLGTETILSYTQATTGTFALWLAQVSGYGKPIFNYEGGFQVLAPTTAQLQASNISSINSTLSSNAATYSATITNMITAYKLTSTFQTLVANFLTDFIAGSPSGSIPSWYTFCYGIQPWSLCNGNLYGGFFTSYNAIENFNYLLNRDLDPASNDNSPVGLGKAA